jgi:hypothetical protein
MLLIALVFLLPNPLLTPGDILTTDTAKLCRPGYAHTARHVLASTKRAIERAYHRQPGCCEIDHLIPLELGGSNKPSNLWAQPYPDAYAKDSVENWAHRQVCAGQQPIRRVQQQMASDWTVLYRAMHAAHDRRRT